MLKIGFPMLTAKNRFQILILHPKKRVFKKKNTKKKHGFKGKKLPINCPLIALLIDGHRQVR